MEYLLMLEIGGNSISNKGLNAIGLNHLPLCIDHFIVGFKKVKLSIYYTTILP